MFPILLQFHLPKFLGHLTWIEIAATVVVIGLLFLWRRSSPRFSYYGFFLWVGIYAALRGMIWYAEPGYHFKLHTYGVMIAVGFVVPIYLAVRQARRELIDPNIVLDLAFWILIAAMAGSRILFIIVNADDYIADPVLLIKVWQGGLVFYGGFIGAVAASWYYCYRKGISFLRISDLLIPSVALGHFFGRLGCYSAGCCHGSPTGVEWFGAVFTAQGSVVSRSDLLGTPIHPTQLYEAFGELCIFVLLLFLRPRKRYNGQLLVVWLLLYPAWRFLGEMFRGDVERGMLFRWDLFGDFRSELLSTSQVVSVGLVGLGVFLYFTLSKKKTAAPALPLKKEPEEEPEEKGDGKGR
jgi:phosphatidylglycerol:prolipoprotein diacylglycerol transferase